MPGRRLLALSLSLAALIGAWAYQSPARAIYALGVEQALARSKTTPDARVRVSGYLVPGSLSRGHPCTAQFRLSSASVTSPVGELRVALDACVPDVLCDLPGIESWLTVEGKFRPGTAAPVFDASVVIAKCAAKYVVPDVRAACERAPAEERRLCAYCGHALQTAGRVLAK